jgi:hypothetical protein
MLVDRKVKEAFYWIRAQALVLITNHEVYPLIHNKSDFSSQPPFYKRVWTQEIWSRTGS